MRTFRDISGPCGDNSQTYHHGATELLFIPHVCFHLLIQKDAIGVICWQGKEFEMFSSALLSTTAPAADMHRLPHCSSWGYIQSLTSAARSPNMCTRPVKTKPIVNFFTKKRAFYNSLLQTENVLFLALPSSQRRREDAANECFKCNPRLFVRFPLCGSV